MFCCAGSLFLLRLLSRCGKQGLLSPCVAWASVAVASPCGAQALGCTGSGLQLLRHVGSVVAAPGL